MGGVPTVVKALITGGAGLVGSELLRTPPPGWAVEVTTHTTPAAEGVKSHRLDLTQSMAFFQLAERRRPDLVIHTAYSKTDHQATIASTAEVAAACAVLDVPLIHFSTDAVFDGDHAPFSESDTPHPIHPYGRAKAVAEIAVLEACPDATIIRTSLVLAADGSDATSRWAIESLRAGERVTFFDDEFRMPILVDDLAAMTWEIATLDPAARGGVWHLCGPERLSRADVGEILCERFGLDSGLIDRASASTMGEPRPRDVSLSSTRADSLSVRPRTIGSLGRHGQAFR